MPGFQHTAHVLLNYTSQWHSRETDPRFYFSIFGLARGQKRRSAFAVKSRYRREIALDIFLAACVNGAFWLFTE